MALVFLIGSMRSDPPNLPSPFNQPATYIAAAIVAGVALVVCMKGLDPYLAIAGIFGFTYLYGAAYLGPRVGVALFAGAVTAGTLVGSVGLDHIGAFGGEVYRVNALRVLGLVALLAGVVLVRSSR
jgi:transporter family-2 protein